MKKILFMITSMFFLMMGFQNCSPQHGEVDAEALSLSSIYPYENKPVYFEDVQIVGKNQEGSNWNYQFIASVVHADNEDAVLDVELMILDDEDNLICPRVEAQVNRSSNNIKIDSCLSAMDYKNIKIEIRAALSGEALEVIREHTFEL